MKWEFNWGALGPNSFFYFILGFFEPQTPRPEAKKASWRIYQVTQPNFQV